MRCAHREAHMHVLLITLTLLEYYVCVELADTHTHQFNWIVINTNIDIRY